MDIYSSPARGNGRRPVIEAPPPLEGEGELSPKPIDLEKKRVFGLQPGVLLIGSFATEKYYISKYK
ncbi:MAG: hypothetical protein AVDCRST_MAG96-3081 [uncultured Segetibacter sp.]|uniref:Uncharacterized protein n=1 Tax=uncultured Segetibacter sp. TaxID=481133 RepID=A0A6J4TJV5_9BACT|nr:MAG: hypothetical protein AVDCRST_MAG96-3081 [uncultured Segetibacter sp.]